MRVLTEQLGSGQAPGLAESRAGLARAARGTPGSITGGPNKIQGQL